MKSGKKKIKSKKKKKQPKSDLPNFAGLFKEVYGDKLDQLFMDSLLFGNSVFKVEYTETAVEKLEKFLKENNYKENE